MTPHFHRKHRRPTKSTGPRREKIEELHPIEQPPGIDSFESWDLGPEILRAIAAMDISVPTPIQALSIGPILEGRDVIAKAQTGTGKTLAFGAPMMARIDPARATVLGLVLCPTRELAQQVHGVLSTLALPRGVRTALTVGGDPIHPQIAQLQAGAQVVVGTPGRVLDLYQQRFLSFPWTEYAVLDEADKMFEIGFLDDVKQILAYTPPERQTLLFSATFPTEVLKLAREATRNPLEVATTVGTVTIETVDQRFLSIDDADRPMALVRLLEQSGPSDVFLVFCARRTEVDRLMRGLERQSLAIKALHGGYDQAARFRVMSAFRTGEVKALIATDVASRGLDVQHVTHVINFSVPRDAEDYTHRIGRTGRAGRSGIAITFVAPADRRRWEQVLRQSKSTATELELPRRTGSRPQRNEAAPERRPPAVPEERGERAPSDAPDRRGSRDREPERSRPEPARRRSERQRPARDDRPPRDEEPPQERTDEGPAQREESAQPAQPEPAREDRAQPRRRRRGSRGSSAGQPAPAAQPQRAPAQSQRAPAQPQRVEEKKDTSRPRRRRRPARPAASEPRQRDDLGRWGDRADDFG